MDYDTYTAHDVIGKVYICLNSLADSGSQNTLDGWFPIFDTLHGVRGEAHVIVKVEIIKDQHRFRQSSIGIRFFACESKGMWDHCGYCKIENFHCVFS